MQKKKILHAPALFNSVDDSWDYHVFFFFAKLKEIIVGLSCYINIHKNNLLIFIIQYIFLKVFSLLMGKYHNLNPAVLHLPRIK